MKSVSTAFLIGVALLAGILTVTAQSVIFNQDFDGGYGGAFGTAHYSGGSPTAATNLVLTTGGNPTGAWTETMTATTWSDYYAGQIQLMTVSGNTDPNPADYVLSFDVMGSGANSIQLTIQSWANNYFGGSQTGNATVNEVLTAANTWQSFSINLGSLAGFAPTGATWQLNFQLNSWQWGGPGLTDSLAVDNVRLVTVPEPAVAALLPLGLAALWMRRWQARR